MHQFLNCKVWWLNPAGGESENLLHLFKSGSITKLKVPCTAINGGALQISSWFIHHTSVIFLSVVMHVPCSGRYIYVCILLSIGIRKFGTQFQNLTGIGKCVPKSMRTHVENSLHDYFNSICLAISNNCPLIKIASVPTAMFCGYSMYRVLKVSLGVFTVNDLRLS